MLKKRSTGEILFDGGNVVLMIVLSILFIVPFIHILFSSLSNPIKLMSYGGVVLWPLGKASIKGYFLVFGNRNIYTGYLNTILYVSVGTMVSLIFTSVMAYVLSRKKVLWNNLMMFFLVVTMFFSGGLIPFYLQIRNLGLYDNRLAVIIPGMISVWNMIIMRTSFLGLPDSYSESAKIDGAGHITILFRVILPLSKAVLAVIGLFYAVSYWNEWFNASIFLRDRDKYPLQLILREILIMSDASTKSNSLASVEDMDFYEPLVKYAAIIVSTLPILMIYPFIQKYFTKGIMIGSIKE